jgi:glutamate/tyrosine decarboxylase-like PLP-dependent enzyme
MAHFTCLAAARHGVLRDRGWDVEADGLTGAPEIRVIAGAEAHVTIGVACRMLGLGQDRVRVVAADEQGRMVAGALREELAAWDGPAIVCAQAGNINTGAFDPFAEIVEICREHGAWCHVDGAFGLWAAASPRRRHLLAGAEGADSWATDGHKWLNVPYDSGIAAVADAEAHRAAMTSTSPYIPPHDPDIPWGFDWSPEFSRRVRGVPVYAALRFLGADGVAQLVDRCCDHAQLMASLLEDAGLDVLNDVVLNQVIVSVADGADETDAVIDRIQREGTCWLSGSTAAGRPVLRISIVGWQTTADDIERSARSIVAAARA